MRSRFGLAEWNIMRKWIDDLKKGNCRSPTTKEICRKIDLIAERAP